MHLKGIIHELLWFLKGDTNIKYLVDNNVNIWNKDAFRWFKKLNKDAYNAESEMSMEQFILEVKKKTTIDNPSLKYTFGDLGKIYGYNWRNIKVEGKSTNLDQISRIIESLKTNPFSRYHILNSWDVRNFDDCALMPCHVLYQFIVRPDKVDKNKLFLDLKMTSRSCDELLGNPYNLASMTILLKIFAKVCNMNEGVSTWSGGDCHIYLDHIPMVKEQLQRKPYNLPNLEITKDIKNLDDILKLTVDDFVLTNYKYHPSIKAELFTGL